MIFFLLIDRTTNEIAGLFKTKTEARLHYIKNNIVERLKICRHRMMTDEKLNIYDLRNIEALMEEIYMYEVDECFDSKYAYIMYASNKYLDKTENLKLDHMFIMMDEDMLKTVDLSINSNNVFD